MDMAILRELFDRIVDVHTVLEIDAVFIEIIQKSRNRLFPYRIGERGQLQE